MDSPYSEIGSMENIPVNHDVTSFIGVSSVSQKMGRSLVRQHPTVDAPERVFLPKKSALQIEFFKKLKNRLPK